MTHVMVLEITHPSGAEGWYCPTCGRRTLISWMPHFQRIVLEAGEAEAIHSVTKDDHSLAAWSDGLDAMGFDGMWEDK